MKSVDNPWRDLAPLSPANFHDARAGREELANELRSLTSIPRAATAIRRFAGRELLGIAYDEFVRGVPPDQAARQISQLTDAVLASALNFAIQQTRSRLRMPQRIDGSEPTYTIMALGSYGGEEIGYRSPLDLLLLCDRIDRKHESHVKFNADVAAGLRSLLDASRGSFWSTELRFQTPSKRSVREHDFHDATDAAALYEREDHAFLRLALMKARVVAGDSELGDWFLQQTQTWIYPRLHGPGEIAEFRVLRRKLERRASAQGVPPAGQSTPIADVPGGRRDIQRTTQFLQLRHGGERSDVRGGGTLAAIAALHRQGCIGAQDASVLAENFARLCRLDHHLAMLSEHRATHLPEDEVTRTQLAWRLGVRLPPDERCDRATGVATRGDLARFEQRLAETLAANRKIINHLLTHDVAEPKLDSKLDIIEIETELILDPDRDLGTMQDAMRGHRFVELDRAIDHLFALSHETVSILSSRRCRLYFAAVAPRLLRAIAAMPGPDETLARLVAVTDAIGAKATLWDLLDKNPAVLRLMVRLCSLAPSLIEILIENPGMIDELIDSLAMDRLPRAERLDMQAIRLCGLSDDVRPILLSFQTGCHLMIGIRDLLDKETVSEIGEALSDTADAILRRVIQSERERMAAQFGDPVDEQGQEVEMIAVALGDFGGREPSYHSSLDVMFLYTAEGQTRRRAGGPRATLSNQQFFNELAHNVVCQLDSVVGQLYELHLPLAVRDNETQLSQSIDAFVKRFQQDSALLWQRAALCQARPFSGSRAGIEVAREAISQVVAQTPWHARHLDELKELRRRSESTARPGDLRWGAGGTADVQWLVAAGVLQSSTVDSVITATGIVASLEQLSVAGVYAIDDAQTLSDNYLYLRKVEAKLGLLNTTPPHELPRSADGGIDSPAMEQLAALLGESDLHEIVRRCEAARREKRELFDRLLTADHPHPA